MGKDGEHLVTIEASIARRSVGGLGFLITIDQEREAPVITEILNGGADADGLAVGDIIVEIDGKSVEGGLERISELLLEPEVGAVVKVKALRKPRVTFEENGVEETHVKRVRNVRLKNIVTGNYVTDTLHQKAFKSHCTPNRCVGSLLFPYGGEGANRRPPNVPRPKEEVKEQAIDFFQQYYTSLKRENSDVHKARLQHVLSEIERTGTYDLEEKELFFGARAAWRNAPRCIGRIHWKKLQTFDCRHVTTTREMYECLLQHLTYATNKGNLRSAITIFPQRTPEGKDYRLWNSQMVRYAGYEQPDGSIRGDPANVEITKIAQSLGWRGAGTMFDVLPWILQANGEYPEFYPIPEELVLQVDIKHPTYPAFNELGLKWYALPAVADMMLDCGGVEFPACPFNGWYMATELARNFLDVYRYNLLEPIAKKLGLDTSTNSSMWKDKVMVEVTYAVLYSFNEKSVTMVDHHTTAETFMKHMSDEASIRGGCPADWVWIVPPMSGSLCPVFHQEMLNYVLKPSFEYQDAAYKHFPLRGDDSPCTRRRMGFKQFAKIARFSAKLMRQAMAKRYKVTILYASETGKAEGFAKMLNGLFLKAFASRVSCMDEYDALDILNEQCVLIVASTTGNGDAPANGEEFGERIYEMANPRPKLSRKGSGSIHLRRQNSSNTQALTSTGDLEHLRFACFGLGSRAYPHFCAYGRTLDGLLETLGGNRMYPFGEGDELGGQQESFFKWAKGVFAAACEEFCLTDMNIEEATSCFSQPTNWNSGSYRFVKADKTETRISRLAALSKYHNKQIGEATVIDVKNLQDPSTERVTDLVRLQTHDLSYLPGDHLSVYPSNRPEIVNALLKKFPESLDPDELIHLEVLTKDSQTSAENWRRYENIPTPTSLREIFSRFVDICSPPSIQLLSILAKQATARKDIDRLMELAKGTESYQDWSHDKYPHLVEVLDEFPSVKVDPTIFIVFLPKLQPRSYSISSSLSLHPGEVHATVALVSYRTQEGTGPLHYGVCSSWLNDLQPGDQVPCVFRPAPNFRLPNDWSVPVILIGPGTGIAPFRSFWQQRLHELSRDPELATYLGKMDVYFGCRNEKDDIYRQELLDAKQAGAITDVFTAYSRTSKEKQYVQDLLRENMTSVCETIVTQFGHVFVCGDVTMAADVLRTLQDMLEKYIGLSQEDAQKYFLEMRTSGRYHEDIFGVTLKTAEVTGKIRTAVRRASMIQRSMSMSQEGVVPVLIEDRIRIVTRH